MLRVLFLSAFFHHLAAGAATLTSPNSEPTRIIRREISNPRKFAFSHQSCCGGGPWKPIFPNVNSIGWQYDGKLSIPGFSSSAAIKPYTTTAIIPRPALLPLPQAISPTTYSKGLTTSVEIQQSISLPIHGGGGGGGGGGDDEIRLPQVQVPLKARLPYPHLPLPLRAQLPLLPIPLAMAIYPVPHHHHPHHKQVMFYAQGSKIEPLAPIGAGVFQATTLPLNNYATGAQHIINNPHWLALPQPHLLPISSH